MYRAAAAAVTRARNGEGPTLLNLTTYRFGGHYVGDAEVYRQKDEVERMRAADPIPRWESALADAGILDADATESVWVAARAEAADAEQFSEDSPYPDPDTALDWVFTEGPRP